MSRRLVMLVLVAVVAGPTGSTVRAQKTELPDFPRLNVSRTYRVDPSWPKRPDGLEWDHVPGIFVDGKQQVWIFTRTDPAVQVFTTSGRHVRSWGRSMFGRPHQIKLDHQGNVWVADQGNHCVMKLTQEGKPLLVLGTRGESGDDQRHMNNPTDMVVSPSGDIFVSDGYANSRVMHFDKRGRFVKMWGKLGVRPGEFSLPHAIAMDSKGRLYVADRNNARVQVFNQDGKFLDQWRHILVPWGFCVTADDEIWACGSGPMSWRKEDVVLGVPPANQVLVKFYWLRGQSELRKKPSTSELIDWIAALLRSGITPDQVEAHIPFLGSLLKNEQDTLAVQDYEERGGNLPSSWSELGPKYNQ